MFQVLKNLKKHFLCPIFSIHSYFSMLFFVTPDANRSFFQKQTVHFSETNRSPFQMPTVHLFGNKPSQCPNANFSLR